MKRTISASVFVLMLVLVGNAAGWTDRGISNPSSPGSVSYDAGEFFRVDGRKIRLLRSLEKVAIRHVPSQGPAIMRSLEATREPKRPYRVDREVRELGLTVLQTERLGSLNELDECIYQLERRPGIERAVPVYIHEESGLEVICTDQFIVKLAAGATLAELDAINKRMGATIVRRLRGATDQFILALPHCTAEELLTTCEVYWQNPTIEWAEPDFLGEIVERNLNPNDPLYRRQWHLNNMGKSGGTAGADVNAPEAWSTTTGSDQIIIAILDDGVDLEHEDLKQNIASNPKEQPGDANGDGRPGVAGVDDDGDGQIDEDSRGREPGDFLYTNDLVDDDDENGYIDDCNGWDFYDDDNDPSPVDVNDNHGTTVAGLAAAKGNNGIGVAGCAFNCKLMPLKVARGDSYYVSRMAEAIRYAAGICKDDKGRWRGADVLNISLGFSEQSVINDALSDASTQGRDGKSCPIFCGAGNDASGWYHYTLSGFPSGTYTFSWEYEKNSSGRGGDDAVWIDDVTFPGGATEGFEGAFPPDGWTTNGHASWIAYGESDRVRGTGARSARSGSIGNNQTTYLRTAKWVGTGDLTFWAWCSSELNFDFFNFYVNGTRYFDESGVPTVTTAIDHPASHPETIAVGASTNFDYRADYSRYGPELDFVAPSNGGDVSITTTDRTGEAGYNDSGDYDFFFGGTSASAPLAAGVAALMLSKNPNLTAHQVRDIMQQTCRKIGGVVYDANGWNEYYSYGCINAGAAVGETFNVITIGTGTSYWNFPMHTYYQDSRTQVIYLASEIGRSGTITALSLNVTHVPAQTMNNWTIRMKHTTMSEYSTCSLDATGWTVVYQDNETVGSTGWRTFEFQTPFEYNGEDNLLVDFSHNNDSHSGSGWCRYSTPGGQRSAYAYSNSKYGDPLNWPGATSPQALSCSDKVPNVKLTILRGW